MGIAKVKNDQLDELYISGGSKLCFENFQKITFRHVPGSIMVFPSNKWPKKIIFLESAQVFLYTLKFSGNSEVVHFPKSVILTENGSYDKNVGPRNNWWYLVYVFVLFLNKDLLSYYLGDQHQDCRRDMSSVLATDTKKNSVFVERLSDSNIKKISLKIVRVRLRSASKNSGPD
jgi:hypothetical protein